MVIPRATDDAREAFKGLVPPDPRITVKPMFGNVAAFCNGHMFFGVFGSDLFIRLAEPDRASLLAEAGTAIFEPTAGRPMREYVVLPAIWRTEPATLQPWIRLSVGYVDEFAPKKPKPRKT